MGMKVLGWVICGILFMAFLSIFAVLCFMMPSFETKSNMERLSDPSDIQLKASLKCEPKFKKEKFLIQSNYSYPRLPDIISPPYHKPEKKTSTTKTTSTTKKTVVFWEDNILANFQNLTNNIRGQNWTFSDDTHPSIPHSIKTEDRPVIKYKKNKIFQETQDIVSNLTNKNENLKINSTSTESPTTTNNLSQTNIPLKMELENPRNDNFWLLPKEQKLMRINDNDS
ncbi:uncharacterized protein LOC130665064 [Microplitis mediator]|uniref:uncharacterized protein LOC130665064 n=1 Tax=Microplitis mediator TaxID=375433 RepID=UPI002557BC97|nr:uncharacterized protein LOC130665064 [Microplitis mediator]